MTMNRREFWVDNVKTIACILVVLGHFFQSMTKAEILPINDLYLWFNQSIYYFHVPLFFICSGYLYQRYSKVDTVTAWWHHVLKKLLVLGVPYVTFSIVTWVLKTLFASSVNNEIGGLVNTLLVSPASPYWYLYALLFVFLITPTFSNQKTAAIGLVVAFAFKVLSIADVGYGVSSISYIMTHEIWFVIGMCLAVMDITQNANYNKKSIWFGCTGLALFAVLSVVVYMADVTHGAVGFAMGILACAAIISAVIGTLRNRKRRFFNFFAKYSFPIFLMHTLFAAPVRTVLLQGGVHNPTVHIIAGLMVSFMGPIVAAWIMKKTKWLEIFLYPAKFVRYKKVKS